MTDSVFGLLAEAAKTAGDDPAIVYGDDRLTWAELEELARRCGAGLRALGVEPGDRVAFWLPNTIAYVALYFGCVQLGAVAVAVNTRFRAKEVADIVGRSRAKALILWPGFRGIDFMSILQDVPEAALQTLESVVIYSEGGDSGTIPEVLARKSVITYQDLTGTTSAPKFVLHRQQSVIDHAHELAANMAAVVGAGALLQTLPFCGVFGFTGIIHAVAGRTQMIVTSSFDPAESVRLVDEHDVRYLNATDDMLLAMLDADPREPALPNIVCCGYGAFNASPHEIAERAGARGLNLVGLYGMSEVLALFARRHPDADPASRILGGGSLVSASAEVRARDPDSGAICPHGQEGELEIKGPSLMSEYFENADATAAAFTEDGFLKTGDLGYTTAPGEFVYLTRMGDTLRLGGFLVSPVEIESHLAEHPSVAGAQVVSVRVGDATRAFAFVVPAAGADIDGAVLQEHCGAALARFKVPVRYEALAEFPTTKSANGTKIQRGKLRELAQDIIDG